MTPQVQRRLVRALKEGNWRGVACAWAGIGQRTLRDWMGEGKEHPAGPYGALRRAVLEAEKSAEMRCVRLVMAAARLDARHAEWWLERKAKARWGRTERKPSASGDGDPSGLTTDDLIARVRQLLAAQPAPGLQ